MARSQTKARSVASRTPATAAVDELATMRDTAERVRDVVQGRVQHGMAAGSQPFAVLGERAFDAWMRSSNETLQRVVALNAELASWGREQLDDSLTAVRSLSQCRSFGDAYGVQLGLVRSSMENSLRRANRLLGLTANLMATGVQATQRPLLND